MSRWGLVNKYRWMRRIKSVSCLQAVSRKQKARVGWGRRGHQLVSVKPVDHQVRPPAGRRQVAVIKGESRAGVFVRSCERMGKH